MPENHALVSPSGAKKWLNCPGSVWMEKQIEEKPSPYADEGTTAHALGELKINLALKRITKSAYNKKRKELAIDESMDQYTDGYRDYVMERYAYHKKRDPNTAIYIEKELDLSAWIPEGFGTADVIIVETGQLEIIDLKYGQGVKVEADDNPQLQIYALGALTEFDWIYDIGDVIMTIYQPRLDNISTQICDAERLVTWGLYTVRGAAGEAFQGIERYRFGVHCDEGFCKARPFCKAYNDAKLEIAKYEFRNPNLLTDAEISAVLDRADSIAKWVTLVKDYALDQAVNHGTKYPGYKIVEGRSNRTWSETEEVIGNELVEMGFDLDDVRPRKLITITAAEKLTGKKEFKEKLEKFTVKPQGKPTLVPESDKRPELNSAEEDFKEEIKEEK